MADSSIGGLRKSNGPSETFPIDGRPPDPSVRRLARGSARQRSSAGGGGEPMTSMRRSIRSVVATAAALAIGLAVPARPAGAVGTEREVLFFASPTSAKVVALAGARRAELDAFPAERVLAGHFTSA